MNIISFTCMETHTAKVEKYLAMNEIDYYKKGLTFHVLSERPVENIENNIKNFLKLYEITVKDSISDFKLLFTGSSKEFFAKSKAKDLEVHYEKH